MAMFIAHSVQAGALGLDCYLRRRGVVSGEIEPI